MTRDDILALLAPLRLRGNHVIVHASLRAFGNVDGGAYAVCQALAAAVAESGTVVLPTFTYAEVLAAGIARRGLHTPYHPDLPVSREIGAIAEAFRKMPGVVRSNHPTHSFAALGRAAREVLSTQRDNNPLGPLKKLNLLQGHVLMLGTSLHSATVVHLAEERMEMPYLERRTALRINSAGHEERVVLENVPGCSTAFDRLEARLDPQRFVTAALPHGSARKIPIRYLLTIASAALDADGYAFVCDRQGCTNCLAKREALAGNALIAAR
jgi:aminoglycoside 3-N-acetyltransferase